MRDAEVPKLLKDMSLEQIEQSVLDMAVSAAEWGAMSQITKAKQLLGERFVVLLDVDKRMSLLCNFYCNEVCRALSSTDKGAAMLAAEDIDRLLNALEVTPATRDSRGFSFLHCLFWDSTSDDFLANFEEGENVITALAEIDPEWKEAHWCLDNDLGLPAAFCGGEESEYMASTGGVFPDWTGGYAYYLSLHGQSDSVVGGLTLFERLLLLGAEVAFEALDDDNFQANDHSIARIIGGALSWGGCPDWGYHAKCFLEGKRTTDAELSLIRNCIEQECKALMDTAPEDPKKLGPYAQVISFCLANLGPDALPIESVFEEQSFTRLLADPSLPIDQADKENLLDQYHKLLASEAQFGSAAPAPTL